jgi:gas vesicle protein
MVAVFLLGSIAGATAALLLAPQSGERTRRKIRRRVENAGDSIMDAGKDLVDNCEDLYQRTSSLAEEGARELSHKYKDLYERSRNVVGETASLIRR